MAQILAFSGSLSKNSLNQKLVAQTAGYVGAHGCEANVISLRDFDLPLMNTDIEAESGLPRDALRLKDLMKAHDGFLIGCPEYNSSITPALKNALDWASRKQGDEKPLVAYRGKVAGLLAASPGGLGGLRGLVTVRSILGNIGVIVVPDQVAVGGASGAFNDDGTLKDEATAKRVAKVARSVVATAGALATSRS